MDKEEKVVDYLDLMARQAEEESEKDWCAKLPEPQGDQVVDYLSVAAAWEEERNRRGV